MDDSKTLRFIADDLRRAYRELNIYNYEDFKYHFINDDLNSGENTNEAAVRRLTERVNILEEEIQAIGDHLNVAVAVLNQHTRTLAGMNLCNVGQPVEPNLSNNLVINAIQNADDECLLPTSYKNLISKLGGKEDALLSLLDDTDDGTPPAIGKPINADLWKIVSGYKKKLVKSANPTFWIPGTKLYNGYSTEINRSRLEVPWVGALSFVCDIDIGDMIILQQNKNVYYTPCPRQAEYNDQIFIHFDIASTPLGYEGFFLTFKRDPQNKNIMYLNAETDVLSNPDRNWINFDAKINVSSCVNGLTIIVYINMVEKEFNVIPDPSDPSVVSRIDRLVPEVTVKVVTANSGVLNNSDNINAVNKVLFQTSKSPTYVTRFTSSTMYISCWDAIGMSKSLVWNKTTDKNLNFRLSSYGKGEHLDTLVMNQRWLRVLTERWVCLFNIKKLIAYSAGSAALMNTISINNAIDNVNTEVQLLQQHQMGLANAVDRFNSSAVIYGKSKVDYSGTNLACVDESCISFNLISEIANELQRLQTNGIPKSFLVPTATGPGQDWSEVYEQKTDFTFNPSHNAVTDALLLNVETSSARTIQVSYHDEYGRLWPLFLSYGFEVEAKTESISTFLGQVGSYITWRYTRISPVVSKWSNTSWNLQYWRGFEKDDFFKYQTVLDVTKSTMWVFLYDPSWILPVSELRVRLDLNGVFQFTNFIPMKRVGIDGIEREGMYCAIEVPKSAPMQSIQKLTLALTVNAPAKNTNALPVLNMSPGMTSPKHTKIKTQGGALTFTLGISDPNASRGGIPQQASCGIEFTGESYAPTFYFTNNGAAASKKANNMMLSDELYELMYYKIDSIELTGTFTSPSKPSNFQGVSIWNYATQLNTSAINGLQSSLGLIQQRLNSLESKVDFIFSNITNHSNNLTKISGWLNTAAMVSMVVAPNVGAVLGGVTTLLDMINSGMHEGASGVISSLINGMPYAAMSVNHIMKYNLEALDTMKIKIKELLPESSEDTLVKQPLWTIDSKFSVLDPFTYGDSHAAVSEGVRNFSDRASTVRDVEQIPLSDLDEGNVRLYENGYLGTGIVQTVARPFEHPELAKLAGGFRELEDAGEQVGFGDGAKLARSIYRQLNIAPEHAYVRFKFYEPLTKITDTKFVTHENWCHFGVADYAVTNAGLTAENQIHDIGNVVGKMNVRKRIVLELDPETNNLTPISTQFEKEGCGMSDERILDLANELVENDDELTSMQKVTEKLEIKERGANYAYRMICEFYSDTDWATPKHEGTILKQSPIVNPLVRSWLFENIEQLQWNYNLALNNCQTFANETHKFISTGVIPSWLANDGNLLADFKRFIDSKGPQNIF